MKKGLDCSYKNQNPNDYAFGSLSGRSKSKSESKIADNFHCKISELRHMNYALKIEEYKQQNNMGKRTESASVIKNDNFLIRTSQSQVQIGRVARTDKVEPVKEIEIADHQNQKKNTSSSNDDKHEEPFNDADMQGQSTTVGQITNDNDYMNYEPKRKSSGQINQIRKSIDQNRRSSGMFIKENHLGESTNELPVNGDEDSKRTIDTNLITVDQTYNEADEEGELKNEADDENLGRYGSPESNKDSARKSAFFSPTNDVRRKSEKVSMDQISAAERQNESTLTRKCSKFMDSSKIKKDYKEEDEEDQEEKNSDQYSPNKQPGPDDIQPEDIKSDTDSECESKNTPRKTLDQMASPTFDKMASPNSRSKPSGAKVVNESGVCTDSDDDEMSSENSNAPIDFMKESKMMMKNLEYKFSEDMTDGSGPIKKKNTGLSSKKSDLLLESFKPKTIVEVLSNETIDDSYNYKDGNIDKELRSSILGDGGVSDQKE